jgi:arsenate reductase-like glutaredoxin family protein
MNLAKVGNLEVAGLLNTGSKTFKELKVDAGGFNSRQMAELLQEHPKAMYRPLLTDGKSLVVGFAPEKMKELLD